MKNKTGRLHLRLDEKLLKKAKQLADRRGVTLTALMESFLRAAIATDEFLKNEDAEQI